MKLLESQVAMRNNVVLRQKIPAKCAWRLTLISRLMKAMIEHVRSARDYAHVTQRQMGLPQLLPRPTQRQLASQLGVSQASVNRCLTDPTARELQHLWNLAVDVDRIMRNGNPS